jgi:regulator of nucleoside diphosphate kinase
MTPTPIIVTDLDKSRNRELIDRPRAMMKMPTTHVILLDGSLDLATVVGPSEVPRNVATLNSRVVFRMQTDTSVRVTTVDLVQPAAADPLLARRSVLSPIGSALIGLREGESIDWPDDTGARVRYTLLRVIFQPEAVGRFDL